MPNLKNILYLIIFIINLCQSSTSSDHQKHFNNLITPVVMIANRTLNGLLDETMVQYGSIIHPRYVLTFAEVLKGHQSEDLLILIDCYSDWYIVPRSCSMYKQALRFEFIVNYYPNSKEIKSEYGIIVLKDAILLNSRVKEVDLILSDDIVDKSNCLIYSYIHHENLKSFDSYVTPIRVKEINGTYRPFDRFQLIDNNDRKLEIDRTSSEVSFYGSPVVCALENSKLYVQVGISNLKIILYSATLLKANPQISQSSIDFSPEEVKSIKSFLPKRYSVPYSVVNIVS